MKHAFEWFAAEVRVKIKRDCADNVPFGAQAFFEDLDHQGQTISYYGWGAHRQNGLAEGAIQTVTHWAWAMLLHVCIHWPNNTNLELWSFALEYVIWIWNSMPNQDSFVAPMELFTLIKFPSYAHLHQAHVFGCPACILDPKLQNCKKLATEVDSMFTLGTELYEASYCSGLHVHTRDSIWVHLLTILQLSDIYWIYVLALYCLSSMLSVMICSQQCQMQNMAAC
jgi:hypothetical protein